MGGDSLFFDYPCQLKKKHQDDIVLSIDWSLRESKAPHLVVGTSDNCLSLFHEEGLPVENLKVPARDQPPTFVAWGPAPHHLLAAGWNDGAISLWDEKTSSLREDKSVHKSSVALLKWSPCGTRLVSTDTEGTVGVWKHERGRPVMQCKIPPQRSKGAVTHVVFRTNDPRPKVKAGAEDMPIFYFAGEDGIVYQGSDDKNHVVEVMKMDASDGGFSGTMVLMYYHDEDQVVGINEQLIMYRASGPNEAGATEVMPHIKLAARPVEGDRMMQALWVNTGLLLTSSNESLLRFWKLSSDENFVLRIEDEQVPPDDRIQSIAYSEHSRLLCAGTAKGYILFWRQCSVQVGEMAAEDWQPLLHATTKLGQPIDDLKWAQGHGLLAAQTETQCSILIEHELQRKLRDGCALVQLSNKHLGFASMVRQRDEKGACEPANEAKDVQEFWAGRRPRQMHEISSQNPIKGCDCNATKIVTWSGRKAEVHQIDLATGAHSPISSFATTASNIVISSDSKDVDAYLYMAVEGKIEVANLQGNVTRSLLLGEFEGNPLHLDMHGSFLVSTSTRGMIRIWDLSTKKSDPKPPRAFENEQGTKMGQITSVRVNKGGNRISILSRPLPAPGAGLGGTGGASSSLPDTNIYVYDVDSDAFSLHNCGPSHFPVSHSWDLSDDRLLACEVRQMYETRLSATDVQVKVNKAEVCFFFATPREGVKLQHRLPLDGDRAVVVGLQVPHIFLAAPKESSSSAMQVTAPVMRDFVGMECMDTETRKALLEFSYNMTLGNMDEAYKSVKQIKSVDLWENMAHMCVKTARLDVAEVCLSKMGNAAGARAVLEAKEREPEKEAHIAMVAIQLGLLEDAERLYDKCGRYDLLNKMYQASGQWEKAIDVAQKKDRIHLKATHHLWARHLEASGDVQAAIGCYEKADSHRTEVPRLLQERRQSDALKEYITSSNDPELHKWMAQFCESHQKLDAALNYYEKAEDYLAMVRVRCYQAQNEASEETRRAALEAAEELVESSSNLAAALFLARQFEALERPRDAMRLYTKANRYNHAVRIARQQGYDKDVLPLALQAPRRTMLETAAYLENRGDGNLLDAAVTLYHKAGDSSRALQLCFDHRLFDPLRDIADNLGSDTDPALLSKVGDFFMSNSQFDKAVHLFITSKQPEQAMDLCEKHRVKITESMAERLTELLPEKEADTRGVRVDILRRIAELCVSQQDYHLATKKYTQAGMKDKAMDALLKSGDTEKIIYFATVLRSKDIWIRAANYLQTHNWHSDPELMKKIIEFYTKAKAYKQLSMFYDACSQLEIDEFRDYDKALGALKESHKYLVKAQMDTNMLDKRIEMVQVFVDAKAQVKSDPNEFVRMCQQLLDAPRLEAAVQIGDVFAVLIEFYYSMQNFEQCYQLIERMRQKRIVLGPYLDQSMVDHIYRAMDIPIQRNNSGGGDIDEDIADDM